MEPAKKKVKSKNQDESVHVDLLDASNIGRGLLNLEANCCKNGDQVDNCIVKAFRISKMEDPDLNSAIDFIRVFRNKTYCLNRSDLLAFMDRRYRECLQNEICNIRLKHEVVYRLVGNSKNIVVCRKSFSFAYGVSANVIKTISKAIKDSTSLLKNRPFTEGSGRQQFGIYD